MCAHVCVCVCHNFISLSMFYVLCSMSYVLCSMFYVLCLFLSPFFPFLFSSFLVFLLLLTPRAASLVGGKKKSRKQTAKKQKTARAEKKKLKGCEGCWEDAEFLDTWIPGYGRNATCIPKEAGVRALGCHIRACGLPGKEMECGWNVSW